MGYFGGKTLHVEPQWDGNRIHLKNKMVHFFKTGSVFLHKNLHMNTRVCNSVYTDTEIQAWVIF